MSLFLISIAAFAVTYLGGLFALKFRDKLHIILGFSAGAVIGVAFFDLLPEALALTAGSLTIPTVTSIIALGFVIFMLLDRFIGSHHHTHEDEACDNKHHQGTLGVASLSLHSLLDGLAIGLAFQVSTSVGIIVAVAVLVHDFSDGINTVGLILKNTHATPGDRRVYRWLTVDALAPVVGIIVGQLIHVQESTLGILLAVFCGFFIYIGASDLLPESHHSHRPHLTTLATLAGLAVLYIAIKLAGI